MQLYHERVCKPELSLLRQAFLEVLPKTKKDQVFDRFFSDAGFGFRFPGEQIFAITFWT